MLDLLLLKSLNYLRVKDSKIVIIVSVPDVRFQVQWLTEWLVAKNGDIFFKNSFPLSKNGIMPQTK